MSKDMRFMIDKVKNFKQIINENNMKDLMNSLSYCIVKEGMFDAAYFGENGSALRYRVKHIPDVNYGDEVYEMHIDIAEKEQGRGLAEKMLKVFLYKEGGVAYFAHGRITNPNIYKVLDKIKQDSFWLVQEEGDGITVQEA